MGWFWLSGEATVSLTRNQRDEIAIHDARELGEPVDFHEVPLDLARFGAEGEGALVSFLADRMSSCPVDLVVPIGGAGVQFAARQRERLFPDTPVLIVAGDPRFVPPGILATNATLVTQRVNLSGMHLVEREIMDAERRICEFLGLDLAALWQWSDQVPGSLMLTHFYRAGDGLQPPEQMNAGEFFPWSQEHMKSGRTMAIASLDDLPAEAARDRETYARFGVNSTLVIPLSMGGEPPNSDRAIVRTVLHHQSEGHGRGPRRVENHHRSPQRKTMGGECAGRRSVFHFTLPVVGGEGVIREP